MEKEEYQKLWNKFYKYESQEKTTLNDVFSNWTLEKNNFLRLPTIYNEGLSFSNKFGYSSFSLMILSMIASIVSKQTKRIATDLGLRPSATRIFIAFDKSINKTWIQSLIKIFNSFKIVVFTLSSPEHTNETVVRQVLKIDSFIRTVYFSQNEITKSGKIQVFNEKNELFSYEENKHLVNALSKFNEDIRYDFSDQTKVISNQKISMHFISKNVSKSNNIIPAYKKDLIISGKFHDELNQSIFYNIIQKLGYKYRNNRSLNPKLFKGSFRLWRFFRVYNIKPDILFKNNSSNMVEIYLKINGVLKYIPQDFIAFLYIDFLFTHWKKNDMLENGAVLVSLETSRRVITLLENYKIPYFFENHRIKETNVLFSYSNMQFSSGLIDNFNRNNILFLVTIIQMLNTYKSKNNLINYKYQQSEEIYSNYSHLFLRIKFPEARIDSIFDVFKTDTKITKKNGIKKQEIINYHSHNKKYLMSLELDNGSYVLIYYDRKVEKIVLKFENKIAQNESFIYSFVYKYLFASKLLIMIHRHKKMILDALKDKKKKK